MLCYVFYNHIFILIPLTYRVKFVVGAIEMAWMEPQ